ncbi:MAG: methanogenesis marker 1 protein, partial [Methanobacterium sp.]
MFNEVPVKYFGCTHRAIAPEETISFVESKLRTAGVTRIAEITHLDRVGIPVYSAIRPSAAEGAVSIYAGKGATKTQAKA